MYSLNDLLRALITVIIRYHQSQDPMSAKASCEPSMVSIYGQKDEEVHASIGSGWTEIPLGDPEQKATTHDSDRQEKEWVDQLLLQSTADFTQTLSNMIHESTQQVTTRRSLLHYLLHIISTLRQHESLSSLEEASSQLLHITLVDFLKHLQLLFGMNPYRSLPVTFEEKPVDIFGLAGILSQKNSKIARSINELVMSPLNIKQTTEESTIHLHMECFILRKKVSFLSSHCSKNTALIHAKQDAPVILSDLETSTLHMAEQLALQAKEIERLNGLLRQRTTTVPRLGFTGQFRLFSNEMSLGVGQALHCSEEGSGLK